VNFILDPFRSFRYDPKVSPRPVWSNAPWPWTAHGPSAFAAIEIDIRAEALAHFAGDVRGLSEGRALKTLFGKGTTGWAF
jgi:hypothetical protein